jgi:hypothetical protein
MLGASNIAVHLYLRNNLCTVEQIFMKFSISKFYQKVSGTIQVRLKSGKKTDNLHETFMCFHAYIEHN